jgi:hypothetical protein
MLSRDVHMLVARLHDSAAPTIDSCIAFVTLAKIRAPYDRHLHCSTMIHDAYARDDDGGWQLDGVRVLRHVERRRR